MEMDKLDEFLKLAYKTNRGLNNKPRYRRKKKGMRSHTVYGPVEKSYSWEEVAEEKHKSKEGVQLRLFP